MFLCLQENNPAYDGGFSPCPTFPIYLSVTELPGIKALTLLRKTANLPLLSSIKTYRTGTTSRVRKVATIRPKMTTIAMELHHWLDSLTHEIANL